jgi:hypothetical protein
MYLTEKKKRKFLKNVLNIYISTYLLKLTLQIYISVPSLIFKITK